MNNYKMNNLIVKAGFTCLFIVCAYLVNAQTTYIWKGGTSGSYALASNWISSPGGNPRTTPATNDILKFDGSNINGSNGTGNITATSFSTETIGQLLLVNNATVYLQSVAGSSKTLTLGSGNALNIASGSTLYLAQGTATSTAISIAFSASTTATIAGTLYIDYSFTGSYLNTFNTTNSVTTVTGTITNYGSITSTATSLVFNSGSNYNHFRDDQASQTLPVANFTNANVTIQGLSGAPGSTITYNNFPAAMASFSYNASGLTSGNVRFAVVSGTSINVTGNYSILTGGSAAVNSVILAFSSATVNSVTIGGKMTVTNTDVAIGRGAMTWTVTGDLALNSGEIDVLSSLYSSAPSITSSLTVQNFTQTGNSYLRINNLGNSSTIGACTANFTVKGNFTKSSSGLFTTSSGVSTLSGSTGPMAGNLIFAGSAPQTFTANYKGPTGTTQPFFISPNVTIANTGSAGNNTVTLNNILNDSTLTLTSGILVTSATNPVVTYAFSGGSGTAYISGAVKYVSAATSAFTLPLGYNAIYVPITLTPNSTTLDTFLVQYPASTFGTANSPLISYDNSLGYGITTTAAIGATVAFPYNYTSGIVNSKSDLRVAAFTSSWSQVSGSPSVTGSVTTGTISDPTNISFTTTNIYVTVGSVSSNTNLLTLSTYTWAGGATGDYQVSTNWSPNRTSPATSDVLQFTSSVAITNVPTQTIGQLLLSGTNTSVSFKAATGAGRTLTVGNSNLPGNALSIASTDTLRLATGAAATDAISIVYASVGNTGSIAGYLILDSSYTGTYTNSFTTTNSTTTVAGTIINGGSITSTSSNLTFNAGSSYIHNRVDMSSQNFPLATWNSPNVTIQSLSSAATQVTYNNLPLSMANFTINTPLVTTGNIRLSFVSGSSLSITGNYSILTGGSSAVNSVLLAFLSSSVTSVSVGGKMYVSNTNVAIGRGAMSWTVTDSLVLNSGEIDVLSSLYSSAASITSSLTVGNFKQTGNSYFRINNLSNSSSIGACIANFTVKGNFTKTSSGLFTTSSGVSTLSGSAGPMVGNLIFAGSAPQTFTSNSTFFISPNVQIANTGGIGNNTITLNNVLKDSTLTLSSGVLVSSLSNYVISYGIIGGSSSTYISGPVKYISNSVSAFTLPIYYNSKYVPITITPNAATIDTFTVQYPASSGGNVNSPLTSYDNTLGYGITTTASISGKVSFPYTYAGGVVNSTSDLVIAYNDNSTDWYEVSASPNITGSVTSGTILDNTNISFGTTTTYVAVGSINASTNLFTVTTYTWGGGAAGDYQVATNWSPSRTLPLSSDVLQFTSSAIVSNVPTETIAQFLLSGTNTSVSLKAAAGGAHALTIGNGNLAGTDLNIPSTDTLRLATGGAAADVMSLAYATTGNTGSIAGYLILDSTYNNTYINSFTTTNSTTTVTGTVVNGGTITSTTSNLVFNAGSNYIHNRVDDIATQAFPAATWTSPNVTIQGLSSASTLVNYSNIPATMVNFTINTPLVTTGNIRLSLAGASSSLSITGNFFVTTGGTAANTSILLAFKDATVTNVSVGGKMYVTNTGVAIGRGTMTWTVTDSLILNSGEIDILNGVYNSTTTAVTSSLSVGNFKQINGTLLFNGINAAATAQSTASFTVNGNFTKIAGIDSTLKTVSTSSVAGAQIANLIFAGSGAQTYTSNAAFSNDSVNLVINNSAGVTFNSAATFMNLTLTTGALADGGNTLTFGGNISSTSGTATGAGRVKLIGVNKTLGAVTLNNLEIAGTISLTGSPTINGGLTLTSGKLTLGSNDLTYSGTITGGSTSSYIAINSTGKFKRSSAAGVETLFPIGTTASYSPLKFTTSNTSVLTTSIANTITNTPGDPTQVANLQWSVLGSVNPGITAIKYYFNTADLPSSFVITNPCEVGTYVSSYTLTSAGTPVSAGGSAYYVSTTVASIPTSGTNYYVVGNTGNIIVAATTWLGTISTDWFTAGNWDNGVPSATIDAIIATSSKMPVISSHKSVKNLTVASGMSITNTGGLNVYSSLTNNGSILGSGILTLSGSSAQIIAGTGLVGNLTLNNTVGATVTGTLGVSGVLTLQAGQLTTNGNLTFKSTSIANTGTLAPYGASGNTGTISGTVTVERYIPAGYRAYRDMASQLSGVGTIFTNWQEGGSFTSGKGIFITGIGATDANVGNYVSQPAPNSNGIDYSLNGNNSAFTYSYPTFTPIANTKVTLDPFVGYRVLIRGDRSFNLATTPIVNYYGIGLRMVNPTVLRAIGGKLITGTVTYNTTNASGTTYDGSAISSSAAALNNTVNGFSLVANPYVAPVMWGTGSGTQSKSATIYGASDSASTGGINGSYWYLDPTFGATGFYRAYNALTGSSTSAYTNANGTTSTGAAAFQYIQPGQAVFVQSLTTSPKVVFLETSKAVNSTKTAVFGVTAPLTKIYISLLKQDSTGNYSHVDGAAIAFSNDFGNLSYGPQDALKFNNANDNLYISDKGKNLSIDGRLPATANDKLPIAINNVSGTNYQLVVDATNYTSDGFTPYLVDSYRGTVSALTNGTNTITFTVDANVAATYTNRFSIAFKPTTLAVNSIVASASLSNKIATVSWNTVGEKGVLRFEVEKSTDAKSFAKIGQATAKNTATATYSATENGVTATTYFRIKSISEVGTVSYSNVVQLTVNSKQISLYPNPMVGKTLNISLTNVAAGKYTVTITSVLGQKVYEGAISHQGGSATRAITIKNTLVAGTYSVTVKDANGQSVYQSNLVVQP